MKSVFGKNFLKQKSVKGVTTEADPCWMPLSKPFQNARNISSDVRNPWETFLLIVVSIGKSQKNVILNAWRTHTILEKAAWLDWKKWYLKLIYKISFDFLSEFDNQNNPSIWSNLRLQVHFGDSAITCFCPAYVYLLKVNNKSTRKRCEIFSKLTIKTTERHVMLRLNMTLKRDILLNAKVWGRFGKNFNVMFDLLKILYFKAVLSFCKEPSNVLKNE